jgi:hypothetical protein
MEFLACLLHRIGHVLASFLHSIARLLIERASSFESPMQLIAGILQRLSQLFGDDSLFPESFAYLISSLVQGLDDLLSDWAQVLAQFLTQVFK